jgi:hypothetical protein
MGAIDLKTNIAAVAASSCPRGIAQGKRVTGKGAGKNISHPP